MQKRSWAACSMATVAAPVIWEEADFSLPSRKDPLQDGLLWRVAHVLNNPLQQLQKRKGKGETINRKPPCCHVLNNQTISMLTFSSVPPKSALYHLNIWLSRTSFFPESTTQASSFSKKASAAVWSWLSISWWSRFNIYSLIRCILITESLWADVSQGLFYLPVEYRFWLVGSPLPHSSGQNEWEVQRPAAPPNGQHSAHLITMHS